VLEEIGRGVSATVFRAECPSLNEVVAIKMLNLEDQDPGHLDEIRREAGPGPGHTRGGGGWTRAGLTRPRVTPCSAQLHHSCASGARRGVPFPL